MIDGNSDVSYERSERQRQRDEARAAFRAAGGADGLAARRAAARGRLTAEEAAARRNEQATSAGELAVKATTAQPVRETPPADPDAAFRTGVRSVLAAAVLVLLFLWARQRRRGVK